MNARSKALIGAIAMTMALPAAAEASTVSLGGGVLEYDAGGEENSVTVGSVLPGTVGIADAPGVVVTAGAGCSNPENDNSALCTGALDNLDIDVGAGNDLVDVDNTNLTPLLSDVSTLAGGEGDDTIRGTVFRDLLIGGPGDDILEGGLQNDDTRGGEGHDLASYESMDVPVEVDLAQGTAGDGPAGSGDDVNENGTTEGVIGGSGDDTLNGTNAAEEFHGGGGGDTVIAAGGPDDVFGGAGSDELDGGTGTDDVSGDGGRGSGPPTSDILQGGPQADRVRYAERSEPVTVDLADAGTDGSAGEADELTTFEHVEGGSGDDTLRGDAGPNRLEGGPGNDALFGRADADEFVGGAGSDIVSHSARTDPVTVDLSLGNGSVAGEFEDYTGIEDLIGGTASDNLTGDGGHNTIDGSGGADVIDGKEGPDLLRGSDGDDTLNGSEGADTIYGDANVDTADGGPGEDSLRMRDNEADSVTCGDAFDSAIVDPVDTLVGCESSDNGVPPAPVEIEVPVERVVEVPVPTPVPGPVTPAGPAPVDDSRPSIDLAGLKSTQKLSSFKKGLKVSVGCNEPCSFDLELLGSASSVRLARAYDLRLSSKSLSRGSGMRSVTLKPSSRLLKGHKKLSVQLKLTAVDAAGNKSTKTKTMKVR
jgi:Ca2+-binding RTX toxin-like protein